MDINKIQSDADLKAEFNKFKQLSENIRNDVRANEIKKMKVEFTNYFDNSKFTVNEKGEQTIANYNDTDIILIEDVFDNQRNTSMSVSMKLKYEGKEYKISTSIKQIINREYKNPSNEIADTELKRMKRDLPYHKAIVNGDLSYSFGYIIAGNKKEYKNIKEILDDL